MEETTGRGRCLGADAVDGAGLTLVDTALAVTDALEVTAFVGVAFAAFAGVALVAGLAD